MCCGDHLGTVSDSIEQRNHISVCTARKLLNEVSNGLIKFDQIGLIIVDRCDLTRKDHPYAQLMNFYLQCKEKLECPPQVIGMVAGGIYDKQEIAAVLDANHGFQATNHNLAELHECELVTKEILGGKDYLRQIQQAIIHKDLEVAMVAEQGRGPAEAIQLLCKNCDVLACCGSDIFRKGDVRCYHYIVPDPAFRKKITCEEHPDPRIEAFQEVHTTHKIYCAKCHHDWGVRSTWQTGGCTFPVIKCSGFNFQEGMTGTRHTLKKWKDARFEIKPWIDGPVSNQQ
jgi:hypothetical protein